MRCLVVVALLAGCSFSLTAGGGGGDDEVPDGRSISITDDEQDDFAGTLVDGTVAKRGAIEPEAYVLGGWHARAFSGAPDRASYSEIAASVGNPLGENRRSVPQNFDATEGRPKGTGINGGDGYTVLYDGELKLPAGQVELEIEADDIAYLEIALDGENFTTVVTDRYSSASVKVPVSVPAEGWFPIRAAFVEGGGFAFFDIYFTPQGMGRQHADSNHMRTRVTEATGLAVEGFRYRAMLESKGWSGVQTPDGDFSSEPRFDLGMQGDDFALRYRGQIRFDEPGTYSFSAEASANDLWRIWVDHTPVAGTWANTGLPGTFDVPLAGWYDFGVDFSDENGDAKIHAKMSGPGIPDGAISAERLRPAITARTASYSFLGFPHPPINDATNAGPGITTVQLPLQMPTGATVISTDWGFGVENARFADLSGMRIDCATTPATIAQPLSGSSAYYYYANVASCAGTQLPLAWSIEIKDSVIGGQSGAVWNPALTALYAGGNDAPFARTTTFISSPRETPNAIGFGRVTYTARVKAPGSVELALRTADSESALSNATWTVVGNDEVPDIEPGAFVQYRATINTAGWWFSTLERVEIPYIVRD